MSDEQANAMPQNAEPPMTSAQARANEYGWAAQAATLQGQAQAEAYQAAAYWQAQAQWLEAAEAAQAAQMSQAGYPQAAQAAQVPHTPQAAQYAQAGYAQPFPQPPRAPRRSMRELMTKGVVRTLAIVSALVVVTIVAGVVMVIQRAGALERASGPSPEIVAETYLDAAIARDTKTLTGMQRSDFNLYQLENDPEIVPVEIIAGNEAAAESIDLKVSYEVLQTVYMENYVVRDNPDLADQAAVVVKLNYEFAAEGKPVEVWALQVLRLERDFYYSGSDAPSEYVRPAEIKPSLRGPWGVASLDGNIPELETQLAPVGSNYEASIPEKGRAGCSSHVILRDISDFAMQYGGLPVTCLAGGSEFTNFENEDLDYLSAELFPLENAPMTDALGLAEPYLEGFSSSVTTPIVEKVVAVGERRFIFVMALVSPDLAEDEFGEYREFRVVSIVGLDK